MIYKIQCGNTSAGIDSYGAQLRSLVYADEEYMWQGSEDTWPRSAPVLFPVVGRPKDNKIEINGVFYPMEQHGFARDMEFAVSSQSENRIEFLLESNEKTKTMYPYDFRLKVCFTVSEKSLNTQYTVENTGSSKMYYAIGGHPGFRCPHGNEKFEDWELVFAHDEPLLSTPVTPAGVIADARTDAQKNIISQKHGVVRLTRELFSIDAIIFENIRSKTVMLRDSISGKGVRVSYSDFPYIAFWTLPRPDAEYLCIEPWQGIAHVENEGYSYRDKKGVLPLDPNQSETKEFLTEIL